MEMESKLNRVGVLLMLFPSRVCPMCSLLSQTKDYYPDTLSAIYPNTRRVTTSKDEELEQYGIPELSKDMGHLSLPQQSYLQHYHGPSYPHHSSSIASSCCRLGRSSTFSYYMMAKLLNRDSDIPKSPIGKPVSSIHQWKHRRDRFWEDREVQQVLSSLASFYSLNFYVRLEKAPSSEKDHPAVGCRIPSRGAWKAPHEHVL